MSNPKRDEKKPGYFMLPAAAIKALTEVYQEGADKYGEFNYLKPGDPAWNRDVFNHAFEHLLNAGNLLYGRGENPAADLIVDQDAIMHLSHAAWGCLTLIIYDKLGYLVEEQEPTQEQIEKLLDTYQTVTPAETPTLHPDNQAQLASYEVAQPKDASNALDFWKNLFNARRS